MVHKISDPILGTGWSKWWVPHGRRGIQRANQSAYMLPYESNDSLRLRMSRKVSMLLTRKASSCSVSPLVGSRPLSDLPGSCNIRVSQIRGDGPIWSSDN